MLVFHNEAHEEAKRLGSQSICIKPVKISEKLLPNITGVDGAVLLDSDLFVHAYGVIIRPKDGKVIPTKIGDNARGARYNSATAYVWNESNCFILVVSEDGMMNVLPKEPDEKIPQIEIFSEPDEKIPQIEIFDEPDEKIAPQSTSREESCVKEKNVKS